MKKFLKSVTFVALQGLCILSAAATEPQILGGLSLPTLYAPECQAVPYEAITAYQAPGGLRLGKLVLDHPEYARESRSSCSFRPRVHLQPEGLNNLLPVVSIAVGYETPAMAVLETRRIGSVSWYRGQAENSSFWVRDEPEPSATLYRSYERHLVFGVALVSERCDEHGRCQPTTQSLQELAAQAGAERQDSCYGNAYDFVDSAEPLVTLPQGRKAYKVRLAPALAVKYGGKLPAELLVPTYDYHGQWTGFFFSRGC